MLRYATRYEVNVLQLEAHFFLMSLITVIQVINSVYLNQYNQSCARMTMTEVPEAGHGDYPVPGRTSCRIPGPPDLDPETDGPVRREPARGG